MARPAGLLLTLILLTVPLVGCLGDDDPSGTGAVVMAEGYPTYDSEDGLHHFQFTADGHGPVQVTFAPGAVSTVTHRDANPHELALPDNALHIRGGETKRFALPEPVELAAGQALTFLPSPGQATLNLTYAGIEVELDPTDAPDHEPSTVQIVSGENAYGLSALQEANFPHREPGQPNYARSVDYFAEYFEDLGYEVEADPFGTRSLTDVYTDAGLPCQTGPRGTTYCPESAANVVATMPGTDPDAGILFVAGGHFDVVNGTVHGALDNTAGTVLTLELARAMAAYEFEHTLMFGLWGGEENGLVGSNAWVKSHPAEVARIETYWNLDVIGMTWPAPLPQPDPMVIAAGPDVPTQEANGSTADPVSQSLLTWARTIQQDWLSYPDTAGNTTLWFYEGVASGQAGGYTGVNAQSDHTSFINEGVPSYFAFNGEALALPFSLHDPSDTLENMTKYAYFGEQFDPNTTDWPAGGAREEARQVLAQSFESAMFFPFYHAVLVDLGVYDPPAASGGR